MSPTIPAAIALWAVTTGLTGGASIADLGACTGDDPQGVLVVVDFGDDRVAAACTAADPDTGEAALRDAGFSIEHNGSGLICRIDEHPEQCHDSPPFDAYWSYWQAPGSETDSTEEPEWAFASLGPASTDPEPGAIEGWRFGGSGSTPPALPDLDAADTADADGTASTAAPSVEAPSSPPVEAAGTDGTADQGSPLPTILTVVALVLLAVLLIGGARWRRRRS